MNIINKCGVSSGAVVAAVFATAPVFAVDFLVDGEITFCSALACSAADLAVGDPISGTIAVDDAAAGPNSTITSDDITAFDVTIGEMMGGGELPDVGVVDLNTDADGEIASGTASFDTEVDTGFGIAEVVVTLDASTETWDASTDFLGLGTIAAGTLTFTRDEGPDSDADGIADSVDNCTQIANADQRDTDGDLYGNACDADLNNDLIINFGDLGLLRTVFFTSDPNADLNGDGVVNFGDLGIMRAAFFSAPGPSGLAGGT